MLMRDLNSVQDLETMHAGGEVFYFYCSSIPHLIIYDNETNDYKILNLSSYETTNIHTVLEGEYDFPAFPQEFEDDDRFLVEYAGSLSVLY